MKRQEQLNEAWCKYMGKCSTEIMQALAFALRWCDQHPNWISVKDELPPKENPPLTLSVNVLATNGNFIHKDYYDHSIKLWVRAVDWSIENITHWMPLPELPKKGGKEC